MNFKKNFQPWHVNTHKKTENHNRRSCIKSHYFVLFALFFTEIKISGSSLVAQGLRIRCHFSGLGRCYSAGSIPGRELPHTLGAAKKIWKKKRRNNDQKFPNLRKKMDRQLPEAQQTPSRINQRDFTLKYIIIKPLKVSKRESWKQWEKGNSSCQKELLLGYQQISPQKPCRPAEEWRRDNIFRGHEEKTLPTRNPLSGNMTFKN